jgi:hypothetical protein
MESVIFDGKSNENVWSDTEIETILYVAKGKTSHQLMLEIYTV